MQVSETLNEGLKREIKVVVPKADLQSRLGDRLEDAKGKGQLCQMTTGLYSLKIKHTRVNVIVFQTLGETLVH